MNLRIALRNLARNKWRSGLTISGVAVATAMVIFLYSMMQAFLGLMLHGATAVELGHVQVHTKAYVKDKRMHDAFAIESVQLEPIRQLDEVEGASARIKAFALIGHEKRAQYASLIGIDPVTEAAVTELHNSVIDGKGEWFADAPVALPTPPEEVAKKLKEDDEDPRCWPDQTWNDAKQACEGKAWCPGGYRSVEGGCARVYVVLGEKLATLLGVEVGDDLAVLGQSAEEGLSFNEKLFVKAIARTGNSELDRMGAWVRLELMQQMVALDGKVHEVSIKLHNVRKLDKAKERIEPIVASLGKDLDVRTWKEIVPEVAQMIQMSDSALWIWYIIIFGIAGLGILNTQRMSALERRREFGVLLAIGVTPSRLRNLLLNETVLVSFLGALAGAAIGLGLSLYAASAGISMTGGTGEAVSYMGVTFPEKVYFVVTPTGVLEPLLAMVIMGLLFGLYPAFKAAKADAVRAIAGRT